MAEFQRWGGLSELNEYLVRWWFWWKFSLSEMQFLLLWKNYHSLPILKTEFKQLIMGCRYNIQRFIQIWNLLNKYDTRFRVPSKILVFQHYQPSWIEIRQWIALKFSKIRLPISIKCRYKCFFSSIGIVVSELYALKVVNSQIL